uniref:ZP domain-containing protein n=1 Tax=Ditylenchus dipsaci TaxID=166011 RepID=A0A915EJG6_9BILA
MLHYVLGLLFALWVCYEIDRTRKRDGKSRIYVLEENEKSRMQSIARKEHHSKKSDHEKKSDHHSKKSNHSDKGKRRKTKSGSNDSKHKKDGKKKGKKGSKNENKGSETKRMIPLLPRAPLIRENMITVDFGGVTVENSHTTTEIIRGTLPSGAGAMPTPELKYAVEIRHVIHGAPTKASGRLADRTMLGYRHKREHLGAFERLETSKEVVFVNRIKAWAFPTSNEVNIFCNLRVCMSHFCSFANCTEASEPAKRLRRHHQMVLTRGTSDTGTLSDLTGGLSAVIAPTELVTGEPVINEDGVCLKKEELWLIAGCAFLFLVLVLMGGCMVMRYCGDMLKSKQQHQEVEHNKVALEEFMSSRKGATTRNVDRQQNVRI